MHILEHIPGTYSICKLRYITRSDMSLLVEEPFYNISKSPEETTVVCRKRVADEIAWTTEAREDDFKALRVAGQIPFETIGVLANLTDTLAKADVSVFAISTFDTDYLLVKTDMYDIAVKVLTEVGYTVEDIQRAKAA